MVAFVQLTSHTVDKVGCSAVCFRQESAIILNFEVLNVPRGVEDEKARFEDQPVNCHHVLVA